MSDELRNEWTCSGCGVRVYNVGGAPFSAPNGWDCETETCLTCLTEDEDPEDRARRMLLEDVSVPKVGRACAGVPERRVKAIREELIEAGELSPDSNHPKPGGEAAPKKKRRKVAGIERQSDKRERAEDAIRAEPDKHSKEIAREVGVSSTLAWRIKKQMKEAGEL